ncbi:MAG: transglutaminase domain-containing protein [Spirochaetales bacterium]|nr:transglutaminase domain-containing protein [Spirochaetales bacterium]
MLRPFDLDIRKNYTAIILFAMRNVILYILMFNFHQHFREELNLLFLSASFCVAVILALWMEKVKLRFSAGVIGIVFTIILLRTFFFFIFSIIIPIDGSYEADFLYLYFDREFFPALIPSVIVWLFNFLALRYPIFVYIEAGLNSWILMAVFWTEANYNIQLYHPTVFGIFLGVYILFQIIVLVMGRQRHEESKKKVHREKSGKRTVKSMLSYIWVIIPLLFLFIFYLILMDKYNQEAVKNRGGLMESTLFRFDFSKYIKLESEISLNDDLVLIFRKNGLAKRILLRRFVLSEYKKGAGFFKTSKPEIDFLPEVVSDARQALPDPEYSGRETVSQEYFFVNFDPTSLVAMNYPVEIIPLKNWDSSSFLRIYKVISRVNQVTEANLPRYEIPPMSDELYALYTDYGNDEKIKELADTIIENKIGHLDKILAIEYYLQSNYLYSLKPGIAADGDQLHHFLFESKKGYCSYFAFAMALLCRSQGIPARVAVGFFANPDWEVLNFYEIKANQAHAWVEVYFKDMGWIEFDPTSSNIAPGEDISFTFEFEFSDKLKNLINEILDMQDKFEEETREEQPFDATVNNFADAMGQVAGFLVKYWFISLPAAYLLLLFLIKYYRFFLFVFSGNIREKTKHLFLFSQTKLYGLGWLKKQYESIMEYSLRMEKEKNISIQLWASQYLKAAFDEKYEAADFRISITRYREFKTSFNRNTNIFIRVLGFLNPVHVFKRKR